MSVVATLLSPRNPLTHPCGTKTVTCPLMSRPNKRIEYVVVMLTMKLVLTTIRWGNDRPEYSYNIKASNLQQCKAARNFLDV